MWRGGGKQGDGGRTDTRLEDPSLENGIIKRGKNRNIPPDHTTRDGINDNINETLFWGANGER